MEHMFKKTSLALIVLGLSTAAFANGGSFTAPAKADFAVTVPNQDAGWHVGVNGLVFKGTSRYNRFAQTTSGDTTTNHAVDPDFDLGFDVNAGYHFAGTGSDVSAAFEYFNSDDDDSVTFANTVPGTTVTKQKADAEVDYWAVDLMGHTAVDVGNNLDMLFGAGLRYANLDNTYTTSEYKTPATGMFRDNEVKLDSDLWGIGPRITFDGFYDIVSGFGIEAGLGASMLFGDQDVTTTTRNFNADGTLFSNSVVKTEDSNQVTPELDAKLGLGYIYHINQDYSMGFHAGWKSINYFEGGVTGDVGMTGPYFGLTFRG